MSCDDLLQVLQKRGGLDIVNYQESDNQLRLMGRVPNASVGGWLLVVRQLFLAIDGSGTWSVDISKQYFLKGGKLVFGWRVIFQDVDRLSYPPIVAAINGAPEARVTLSEQAFPAIHSKRNVPTASNNGKGAQGVLTASIGPAAIRAVGRR